MKKERKLAYSGNVTALLHELAQYESGEDFIGGEFDVYGEDENGVEGFATVDIVELATDAHQLITELKETLEFGQTMNMADMLDWVADRLVYVHHDNENADFIHSLRERAKLVRNVVQKL